MISETKYKKRVKLQVPKLFQVENQPTQNSTLNQNREVQVCNIPEIPNLLPRSKHHQPNKGSFKLAEVHRLGTMATAYRKAGSPTGLWLSEAALGLPAGISAGHTATHCMANSTSTRCSCQKLPLAKSLLSTA